MERPLARSSRAHRPWFVRAVLVPFLLTRALLLVTAWFSERFAPSWTYPFPVGSVRGWVRVPSLALDVWGRYDTYWYLDVAARGYRVPADLAVQQSNLAFFPLYPWLVRGAHALLPAAWQGDGARYLAALALANLFAVAGLALVYLVLRDSFADEDAARRATLYLLLFPGSFYLSCTYTESLFLLLSAAALLLALRGRWALAIPVGVALGLARPSGVLFAVPLLLIARAERAGGVERRSRIRQALAILAPPAGFAAHAVHLALLTGVPTAVFKVQAAWGRSLAAPWSTLLWPTGVNPTTFPFELAAVLLVLALSLVLFAQEKPALGFAALASVVPVLLSGTLMSATRLVAVAFPAFAPLGLAGRRHGVDRAVTLTFVAAQVLLFLAWARFYWVA